MAWFQRQNKLRRVSADRSRPVPQKPGLPLTPPGKRAGRYLMTALFVVGGLVILNFPSAGPRIRVGEIARRDYRARLTFEMQDTKATLDARANAEARCSRIFVEDSAHLKRIPDDLTKFLQALIKAHSVSDLAAQGRAIWGVTSTKQLDWLKEGLDEKWVQAAAQAVRSALDTVAGSGIMDGSKREQEIDANRYDIVVRDSANPDKEQTRAVGLTREYPGDVRRVFEDELQTNILMNKSETFREACVDLLVYRATPTLTLDDNATKKALQAARESVAPRLATIAKDSIILAIGERATAEHIVRIRKEAEEFGNLGALDRDREGAMHRLRLRIERGVGVTALFLVGFVVLTLYAVHFASHVLASNTRVFGVYTVSLVALAAVRLLEEFGFSVHWTPVVLAAMIIAVTSGPTLAFGVAGFLALIAGIATNTGLTLAVPLLAGGFAAVLSLLRLRRRTDLIEAGAVAGVVQFVVVWAVHLARLRAEGPATSWPVHESLVALGSGMLAGFVLTGTLPYVEKFFDVATDLRLFEWTDQNQPLLRKLAFEAPGTYHHSTVVGNIAEAAAEEIGANALLARAGAYLHDVGKLNRPEFYVENTSGSSSRHEELSPTLSTMILTAHTKDGVELAARYGVPSPLRRIIAEHHGTSVVEYFYDKALKAAENPTESVRQGMFRYRGPKPRGPESAIIMLADSVESAARSIENASPSRIEKLVREIVQKRLGDGQLDESRMNITDIRRVEKSLVRSLMAISHPRIRYPGM